MHVCIVVCINNKQISTMVCGFYYEIYLIEKGENRVLSRHKNCC